MHSFVCTLYEMKLAFIVLETIFVSSIFLHLQILQETWRSYMNNTLGNFGREEGDCFKSNGEG